MKNLKLALAIVKNSTNFKLEQIEIEVGEKDRINVWTKDSVDFYATDLIHSLYQFSTYVWYNEEKKRVQLSIF